MLPGITYLSGDPREGSPGNRDLGQHGTQVHVLLEPLEQVEAFYNIGSRTKADLLQARVNLANDELALLNAQNSAAREAGMQTALCLRPGNAEPPANHDFATIREFGEIRSV